ncbi:MAG: hypothetical protein ABSF09_05495 [Candidatus Bathyarchaeia archaeon]
MISRILVVVGLLMLAAGLGSWLLGMSLPVNSTVIVILGTAALVVGLIMFVTELFESWLSRSQSALVDGLQAG